MDPLKIHIAFPIAEESGGGGRQFLKALREYLRSINACEETVDNAHAVLFNSHHHIDKVTPIRLKHPDKIFVHRIDGPMRLYNLKTDKRDDIVYAADRYLADATIFQSAWSKEQNHRLGLNENNFEAVIHNAPEPTIFNRDNRTAFSSDRKTRLIAASWSTNWNKGFATYEWLDKHLDFDRYEMTFVGNSPIRFRNANHIPRLSSQALAEKLKQCDIFVFASPIEACSNLLLEALHCGLPVVGINGSSNGELIGQAGETFTNPNEIPHLLEEIVDNYHHFQTNIRNPSIDQVGREYYDFIADVYERIRADEKTRKKFGRIGSLIVDATIFRWRLSERLNGIARRFLPHKP